MIRKHLCIPCSGCPLGGLSPDPLASAIGITVNGSGVKLSSLVVKSHGAKRLGQKEIMIKTHCVGRDPYTNTTGFGHMHSIVNAYGLI